MENRNERKGEGDAASGPDQTPLAALGPSDQGANVPIAEELTVEKVEIRKLGRMKLRFYLMSDHSWGMHVDDVADFFGVDHLLDDGESIRARDTEVCEAVPERSEGPSDSEHRSSPVPEGNAPQ